MKATWCQIKGEPKEIFKKPKTDSGMKNSLKGLICVKEVDGKIVAQDQVDKDTENTGLLETVFENGKLLKEYTLDEIRNNVKKGLNYEEN